MKEKFTGVKSRLFAVKEEGVGEGEKRERHATNVKQTGGIQARRQVTFRQRVSCTCQLSALKLSRVGQFHASLLFPLNLALLRRSAAVGGWGGFFDVENRQVGKET